MRFTRSATVRLSAARSSRLPLNGEETEAELLAEDGATTTDEEAEGGGEGVQGTGVGKGTEEEEFVVVSLEGGVGGTNTAGGGRAAAGGGGGVEVLFGCKGGKV